MKKLVALILAIVVVSAFAATTGTVTTQQNLLEAFCDACGPMRSSDVRNLIASIPSGPSGFASRLARFTATLSPAIVNANTCAEQTFTVTGVATGDVVVVNKPTAQAGLGVSGVRASAANQVGINFCNNTAAGITPTASEVYSFSVIQ
jgi:hypothetical protein